MSNTLIIAHLASILPAVGIGSYLLFARKGSVGHRWLGRVYTALLMLTALITLWMPAEVGPRLFDHFGFLHGLSVYVLYVVPRAYLNARNGKIRAHRNQMIGLYVGGIVIAGTLAFFPGRMLNGWLF